jgi:hypothetical protein
MIFVKNIIRKNNIRRNNMMMFFKNNVRRNNIRKRIIFSNNIKYLLSLQKINKINKYTAVIVEPRKHAALPFVLENFLKNLSDEWNIIIFHGKLNKDYVNNIISNKLNNYNDRISTINLNINNLTINEYSTLFKIKDFYNKIPTETFLVFQTDTIIFEKNKHLINNFLKYDYVGAPWGNPVKSMNNFVGNGGLSLRKKSKMIEIIRKEIDINNIAEDIYFSSSNKVQLFKPSQQESKLFSVEHMFSKHTFGSHKPWIIQKHHPEFYTLYPESKILEKLQYVIR